MSDVSDPKPFFPPTGANKVPPPFNPAIPGRVTKIREFLGLHPDGPPAYVAAAIGPEIDQLYGEALVLRKHDHSAATIAIDVAHRMKSLLLRGLQTPA
jgi:hypothetical protein